MRKLYSGRIFADHNQFFLLDGNLDYREFLDHWRSDSSKLGYIAIAQCDIIKDKNDPSPIMARPYSLDLRTRIIKAHQEGKFSIRQIAQRFQVGKNFVCSLLQQWRETGNLSPRPHGGGKPSKLNPAHIEALKTIVLRHNDATLKELAVLLEQETGLKVSPSTICRQLQKLGLTLKKKLSIIPNKHQLKFKQRSRTINLPS
jgi:transposase